MRVTTFLALACAAALPVMASSHDEGRHHAHELGDFGEHHLDVDHPHVAMHHLHGEYPIDHHGHYHGHKPEFHHPHHYGHHHGHHHHHHHHHSGYLHGYHPTHFRHQRPHHHHPHHPTYNFGHHHENHHHHHHHEHPSHHGHEDYHNVLQLQNGQSFDHFRPHYFRELIARGGNPCKNAKLLAKLQAQDGLDPATKITCQE